jgi:phage shock protein PspC (stress-responsive transcriptional regulator)
VGALALGITTAVLAVAADQIGGLSRPTGRSLCAAAAITAGLATLLQRRVGTELIRDWTRARSAAEGIKSEIYRRLAGGTAYQVPDRDQRLGAETRRVLDAVVDLRRHAIGIAPDGKVPPEVHDVDSYVALRVDDQIQHFYRPKAELYERRVRRLRTAGDLLGAVSVVLAGLGAAFQIDDLAAWVAVVTTITTAVVAYITAARYDHLVIEYLRTAQRLEHLKAERDGDDARFVDACEDAISIENEGWMARWDSP